MRNEHILLSENLGFFIIIVKHVVLVKDVS
jgi:hypothetical protein